MTMYLAPNLTRREMRRAHKDHAGLQATWAKAPWWHIASGYYTVSCSCGWTDSEKISTYDTIEGGGPFVTNLGINLAMNRHLEATCRNRSRRARARARTATRASTAETTGSTSSRRTSWPLRG